MKICDNIGEPNYHTGQEQRISFAPVVQNSKLSLSVMPDQSSHKMDTIRILYVGRQYEIATDIETMLAEQVKGKGDPRRSLTITFKQITNQKAAMSLTRTEPPSIVLIELDGKRNSRLSFCQSLRKRLPNSTIFAVTDHALNTPFAFDAVVELPLCAETVTPLLLKGLQNSALNVMECGPVRLNVADRTVTTGNGNYHMTPKQCALLQLLMKNHRQIVRRADIMEAIWNTSYMEDTRTLDVHIRWLRERIEPDPSDPIYLRTIRGVGYRLTLEHEQDMEEGGT